MIVIGGVLFSLTDETDLPAGASRVAVATQRRRPAEGRGTNFKQVVTPLNGGICQLNGVSFKKAFVDPRGERELEMPHWTRV
jgi:hypothetical protein